MVRAVKSGRAIVSGLCFGHGVDEGGEPWNVKTFTNDVPQGKKVKQQQKGKKLL